MKKLLMGIFGLTLLLPLGVFAESETLNSVEGNNSADVSVTIGTVEVPTYTVYINWDAPTFNWTYNKKTGTYNWTYPPRCVVYDSEYHTEPDYYYEDNECSNVAFEGGLVVEEEETYYVFEEVEGMHVMIEDYSENSRIVPSVKWTSDDKYNYVEGKFTYLDEEPLCHILDNTFSDNWNYYTINYTIYTNNSCTTKLYDTSVEYEENKYYALFKNCVEKELASEELPDSARKSQSGEGFWHDGSLKGRNTYDLYLQLENKTESTTTPKAGDTLGTITISIRAAE